jgi:arylformamidase
MKIYDITQELFSSRVFPGDTAPAMNPALRISGGDSCNLTDMNICLHNGTHIDAPFHFFADGKTIDKIDITKCMGNAVVRAHSGTVTYETARRLMVGDPKRLLIKGNVSISPEAARYFVQSGLLLLGVEDQSVAAAEKSIEVHKILLEAEIVILEGLNLKSPHCGDYMLSAFPLKLGGCDGSPCRALLFSD